MTATILENKNTTRMVDGAHFIFRITVHTAIYHNGKFIMNQPNRVDVMALNRNEALDAVKPLLVKHNVSRVTPDLEVTACQYIQDIDCLGYAGFEVSIVPIEIGPEMNYEHTSV